MINILLFAAFCMLVVSCILRVDLMHYKQIAVWRLLLFCLKVIGLFGMAICLLRESYGFWFHVFLADFMMTLGFIHLIETLQLTKFMGGRDVNQFIKDLYGYLGD